MDLWKHISLVERVAKKLRIDASLVAELGLEVLQKCYATHDESKGRFDKYASVALTQAFMRYKRGKKEVPILEGEEFRQNEPEVLNLSEGIPLSIDEVRGKLNQDELELLTDWHCSDMSRDEMSQKYGRSRQYLWQWVQRITKKLITWVAHHFW
jgi:predicted DNA-binding protein (UPF0251 family)